jgi:hypothetical protein
MAATWKTFRPGLVLFPAEFIFRILPVNCNMGFVKLYIYIYIYIYVCGAFQFLPIIYINIWFVLLGSDKTWAMEPQIN